MHARFPTGAPLAALVMAAALVVNLAAAAIAKEPPPAASNDAAAIEPDDEAPETVGDPGQIPSKSLLGIIRAGGIVMLPIFFCSFILLVFAFERCIALRRGRVIPSPFVKRFMHQLREGQLDREQAATLCEENGSPVAGVFAGAVRKWGRPSVEVEQAVLDAGERAANSLRKYVRLFNAIATVSPLLGLLGTVFGMIHSFNEIATSQAMGRPELLAAGISEALITTAAGLTVAIPALSCYLLFLSRVDQLVIRIDALGQELVDIISAEGSIGSTHSRSARLSRREAA